MNPWLPSWVLPSFECNSRNPTMSTHILLILTHIIHFVNVLICVWMWNPICSHRVLQVRSQTSRCLTAAPVTQDYTEWGFRQWKHIQAGNCYRHMAQQTVHSSSQLEGGEQLQTSTSENKRPQKEKHGCLTRMRHESCGLQLQLSAKCKDALTYMIYMIYMIYISMSLQHLSYFYCHAALKWQKHKWNQIYIRSD